MSNALQNVIPTSGPREPFQVDVDSEGIVVSEENPNRVVLVMYNNGPDTAWGNKTIETASSAEGGFPFLSGAVIIDSDSIDAWCFITEEGATADIRGWEISKP